MMNTKSKWLLMIAIPLLLGGCKKEITTILKSKQTIKHVKSWELLDNYPFKTNRNDDVSFVSPTLGWAINNTGKVYRTDDGGKTWDLQFSKEGSYFRALAFRDSLNGWIGTIGMDSARYSWVTDPNILYATTDGGKNWKAVDLPEPYPAGICGLQVVSEKVIVGSGRVRGPAFFIRSEDGGKTWVTKDMNHLAQALIVPHFFDEQNGIMIGGTAFEFPESRAIILSTEDGGTSWDTLYTSPQKGEYAWKISFPSRQVGYVSVQRNVDGGKHYFLKTEDGGKSWKPKEFTKEEYFIQGIGFVNEKVGWIGGDGDYSFETRDGGDHWYKIQSGQFLNKFTFVNDTLGYASGQPVYKLNHQAQIPNGEVKEYDEGKLKSIKHYEDGILEDRSITYYPDGSVASEGNYKQNLKTGKWRYIDRQGKEENWNHQKEIAKLPKAKLEKYQGYYHWGERYIHIYLNKGKLMYEWNGWDKPRELYPVAPAAFMVRNSEFDQYAFVQNDQQKVIGFAYRNDISTLIEATKLSDQEGVQKWEEFHVKVD